MTKASKKNTYKMYHIPFFYIRYIRNHVYIA